MSLHPATQALLRWLDHNHLPDHLAEVVGPIQAVARDNAVASPAGGAELTTGIRKLIEAKDCLVRAAILQAEADAAVDAAQLEELAAEARPTTPDTAEETSP